jgi:hypothetical protein
MGSAYLLEIPCSCWNLAKGEAERFEVQAIQLDKCTIKMRFKVMPAYRKSIGS